VRRSEMAAQDDMPAWVRDLEFLTEPLEGNKANFILQNAQRLRTYFEGRTGKIGQLFSIYDRHPPDTALDPQSGVLYFIRTEEGLQDKAISLKSVASGPSKHTWKMAWGRCVLRAAAPCRVWRRARMPRGVFLCGIIGRFRQEAAVACAVHAAHARCRAGKRT